ncbi:hypothetical protein Tfer_2237 [Thermincola ferriacetica]|uniref:Uncharacterized protein n=1 Tax=Thermincola ferriacetica TaxID=281456 RepID=A0A0L6W174_9FIRM|nr:hypothetical protein [Thermincola ferriacetica]KNZ69133.1 hypothetical protein Tfer_2237 [Thermincola ferriacetica]
MKAVKTVVEAGACGFKVLIMAELDEQKLLNLKFHSACKPVMELNGKFESLNWKKGVFGKMLDSYIYKVCSEHLKHVDCPVPSAILKSVQVLAGAAVEQEVHMKIRFFNQECADSE